MVALVVQPAVQLLLLAAEEGAEVPHSYSYPFNPAS